MYYIQKKLLGHIDLINIMTVVKVFGTLVQVIDEISQSNSGDKSQLFPVNKLKVTNLHWVQWTGNHEFQLKHINMKCSKPHWQIQDTSTWDFQYTWNRSVVQDNTTKVLLRRCEDKLACFNCCSSITYNSSPMDLSSCQQHKLKTLSHTQTALCLQESRLHLSCPWSSRDSQS